MPTTSPSVSNRARQEPVCWLGHLRLIAANFRDLPHRSGQHSSAFMLVEDDFLIGPPGRDRGAGHAGALHLGVACGELAAARLLVQGRQPSMLGAPRDGHWRRAGEQPTAAVLLALEPDHGRGQGEAGLLLLLLLLWLPCTWMQGVLRKKRCKAEAAAWETFGGKTGSDGFSCQLLAGRGRQCSPLQAGRGT